MVGKRSDLPPHQASADRIDVVGRLVQHDHAARCDRRHGECHETLHAAGKPGRVDVQPLPEVEGIDEPLAAAPDVLSRRPAELTEQLDRLAGRQAVDRHLGLGLEGAQPPGQPGIGDHVAAVDADGAGGGPQQSDYLVDQRRLPGAVVAEQTEDLALADGQADPVVGPGTGSVDLRQFFDLQQHVCPLWLSSGVLGRPSLRAEPQAAGALRERHPRTVPRPAAFRGRLLLARLLLATPIQAGPPKASGSRSNWDLPAAPGRSATR